VNDVPDDFLITVTRVIGVESNTYSYSEHCGVGTGSKEKARRLGKIEVKGGFPPFFLSVYYFFPVAIACRSTCRLIKDFPRVSVFGFLGACSYIILIFM
jgi:hypothetical protein